MKKKLITLDNIEDYIYDKEFRKEKNMILSPNVNDYLKVKGIRTKSIELLDGNQSENIIKKIELKKSIINILVTEYKITDEKVIKKVIAKVEEVLRNGN